MTIANSILQASEAASGLDAELVLRVIETAGQVRRRFQFFVWSQSYLRALVPFDVIACGAYQRANKSVTFEVFHTQQLEPALVTSLSDGGSALMHQIMGQWMEQHGHAAILDVDAVGGTLATVERAPLTQARINHLLVHGVSRPQRPAELESFFIFARAQQAWSDQHRSNLELILPQLHATYLRVLASEREFTGLPASLALPRAGDAQSLITCREKQILSWVREGKCNREIGQQLSISALTVKNHVQKILRKLGAANRAQAVAKAMTLNLLERGAPSCTSPFGSVPSEIET